MSLAERLALGQRRAGGIGNNPLAAPVPVVTTPVIHRVNDVIPIANSGPMSVGRSTPWHVIRGGSSLVTVITARDVASGDSTFQWRLNGTLTGNVITLLSGGAVVYDIQAITTAPHDVVDLECLTAGTGLGNLGGRGELNG
jgi:hypothetical protein